MEDVLEVRQTAIGRVTWVAQINGQRREWAVRIVRQVPDQLIAWEKEGNSGSSGTVAFRPSGQDACEVELHVDYVDPAVNGSPDPEGGLTSRVESDLRRFKQFIEQRGMETGAWRGEILEGRELPVAPLVDSTDAPDEDQIRFGVTALQ
jgi:uncharacterized membrane protein